MIKKNDTVLCIGSMGKDIFFPVDAGVVVDAVQDSHVKKQFCFGYGSKVHIDDRFAALGGCACNVSTGLSRLAVSSYALGNIGDDADGSWITETLQKENVNVKKIRVASNSKTDISVILVDTNTGERTIFVNRDVGEKLVLSEDDIAGHEWCFVGSLYGEAITTNMHVLHRSLVRGNIKLAYNPGGHNIANDENVVLDLIYHAHIVFVNKSEAHKIIEYFNVPLEEADLANERVLVETLLEHIKNDDGIVVVTDGRRGAWVGNRTELYHVDTIDKEVMDATGAGDAFASGFLAALLHGNELSVCAQWGSANGDAVVDYYGAQEGLLTYDTMGKKIDMFNVKKIK